MKRHIIRIFLIESFDILVQKIRLPTISVIESNFLSKNFIRVREKNDFNLLGLQYAI